MKVISLKSKSELSYFDQDNPSSTETKLFNSKVLYSALLLASLALLLRFYTISLNLPFFYNEDEAHHFNRVVEMVQRGEYNPHYFHKPSLHFYLRMPVIAASFLWTVKNGHIKSVQDIRARDQYGISGYSFTASHPGIVKWNRALSVGFGVGIVLLAFLTALVLTEHLLSAWLAGLLTAVSPGLIEYGATIGVDAPTAFFCGATVFFALLYLKQNSLWTLLVSGILAGLAVSTKYNALPIVITSLLAAGLRQPRSYSRILLAFLLPIVAFFAASPFILVSLPLFLDQFAYEIWHYGVAEHVGHSAQPGLQQGLFYGKWLANFGVGVLGLISGLLGLYSLRKHPAHLIVLIAFPAIYFLLMSSQRTHFERNMLPLISFLGVLAGLALKMLLNLQILKNKTGIFSILFSLLLISFPFLNTLSIRKSAQEQPESRTQVYNWIENNTPPQTDTALSGYLQLPLFQATQQGVTTATVRGINRLDLNKYPISVLYNLGYDRLVAGPEYKVTSEEKELLRPIKIFPGIKQYQRIVKNPEVTVFGFYEDKIQQLLLNRLANLNVLDLPCSSSLEEPYCWTTTRLSTIRLDSKTKDIIELEARSPWGEQKIQFFNRDKSWNKTFLIGQNWNTISLENLPATNQIFVFTPKVHIPAHHGLNKDPRHLGFAYRAIQN